MDGFQAVWHVLGLLGLPVALAALHAGVCKLLWRHKLAGLSWARLAAWCALAASAINLAGLVWTGHDGAMVTYGAIVLGLALTTWLVGFAPWRRRAG